MEPTQPLATPPGTPDDFDLERIAGRAAPDPVVWLNRLRLRRNHLATALAVWSFVVLLTLLAFLLSGSLIIWLVGYSVTLPYLLACYEYRRLTDRIAELARWCTLEGC